MSFTPSPGTPGEGWGEGSLGLPEQLDFEIRPHPNLLPAYREKEPEEPPVKCNCPALEMRTKQLVRPRPAVML